jgi:pimeloyl-ACP methyl ester carboxylesterase
VEKIEEQVPALRGKIDVERTGVVGHSLGAYSASLLGGATIYPESDSSFPSAQVHMKDPRVKCVVCIAPQVSFHSLLPFEFLLFFHSFKHPCVSLQKGSGVLGLRQNSWEKMCPFLLIAGGQDTIWGKSAQWTHEAFDVDDSHLENPSPKMMVFIHEADHAFGGIFLFVFFLHFFFYFSFSFYGIVRKRQTQ